MSTIYFDGKIGNNCEVGRAHMVEIGRNYNGSGEEAFGGAMEWPVVKAHVGFQVGEERRAIDFAKKLTELIHAEFGPLTTEPPPATSGRE